MSRRRDDDDDIEDEEYEDQEDQLLDDDDDEYDAVEEKRGRSDHRKRSRSNFIDDAAEEDEDEEEEEDDDDEEYGGGGGAAASRKKKTRKGASFFDLEAQVDSDEDDDEDDPGEDGKHFIVDGGADIPDEDSGRRAHRRPILSREDDNEDMDALERQIQERYSRQSNGEYDEETTEVEQQALLPSVRDPKLWMVKCAVCILFFWCCFLFPLYIAHGFLHRYSFVYEITIGPIIYTRLGMNERQQYALCKSASIEVVNCKSGLLLPLSI
ncbi:Putative transcription elongation factor SPT5 homolog 1 [Linum perenne]